MSMPAPVISNSAKLARTQLREGRRTETGKGVPGSEDFSFKQDELPADRSLVIVDDDLPFLQRLARAMTQRGFHVPIGSILTNGAR
jgi:hypothetical protein